MLPIYLHNSLIFKSIISEIIHFSPNSLIHLLKIILLCLFNEIEWNKFYGLLIAGVSFKILIAIVDTPLLYIGVYLRKRFNLKLNDTLKIN